ncbi:LYR motif-containing protein 4 [Phlyctochytrium arcticum]|nr:LYR motif-containing protein 4 [Phlyctochytrium arcticum]
MPSKSQILHLYRDLLRSSRAFSSHNYRDYVYRRTKDAFREHRTEADPQRINALYERAKQDLIVAKRQGYINSQFDVGKSVIEH